MPYKETWMHGENFTEPPPDLIEGEQEWEVEQILDTRRYRSQLQFLIKWKGYSGAHNSWEPEKNLNATDLVKEYYLHNPKKEGAAKWLKTRETIVQTLTTTPINIPLISNMPSRSSSVESLVARATERGYYSVPPSPSPMEVTLTPNQEVIDVDALPQSPISVHSTPSPHPINYNLPFVEVHNTRLFIHPPSTLPAPPELPHPPTPTVL